MNHHEHSMQTHDHDREVAPSCLARGRWVFWVFGIIAAVYLLAEHRAHVAGLLPFAVILLCPLMHMFMHGGHGGHAGHGGDDHAEPRNPREGE